MILFLFGCSPSIETVERDVKDVIEDAAIKQCKRENSLLMWMDPSERVEMKYSQFWLDDHPERRIYTGHVANIMYFGEDSIMIYRSVKIKYRDNTFDSYTYEISPAR
jgi:hypothetical protein